MYMYMYDIKNNISKKAHISLFRGSGQPHLGVLKVGHLMT